MRTLELTWGCQNLAGGPLTMAMSKTLLPFFGYTVDFSAPILPPITF